jgi:hypothetical protein
MNSISPKPLNKGSRNISISIINCVIMLAYKPSSTMVIAAMQQWPLKQLHVCHDIDYTKQTWAPVCCHSTDEP